MDYETLRPWLIAPHAALGGAVLVSGVVAIATKKGGRVHMRAGLVFVGSMLLAILVALPLMVLRGNTFLLLLSPFTAYLVLAGRRAVIRKRNGEQKLSTFDRGLALGVLAGSAGLAVLGAVIAVQGSGLGPVAMVFGGLGSLLSWQDWRRRDNAQPDPKQWLRDHIGMMLGGMIAGLSAFSAVNLSGLGLPSWMVWLWPMVVIVPLMIWFTRRDAPQPEP